MAKIKFGMMMTDARGKLGGQVFSKNRGGSYVRTKVTPSNPQSGFQSAVRALFAVISQAWSSLTAAQRASFNNAVAQWARTDVFGDLKNPSGKNLHQRLNQQAQVAGYPAITTAPLPEAVDNDVITEALFEIAATELGVTPNPSSANSTVVVFATPPLSQGTKFVKNRLRQIYFAVGNAYQPADAYAAYVAKYGAPSVGDNIHIGVKFVNATGNVTPLQTLKSSVIA